MSLLSSSRSRSHARRVGRAAALLLVGLVPSPALAASSPAPAGSSPSTFVATRPDAAAGAPSVPGTRLVEALPRRYVEEEFIVSGQADLLPLSRLRREGIIQGTDPFPAILDALRRVLGEHRAGRSPR